MSKHPYTTIIAAVALILFVLLMIVWRGEDQRSLGKNQQIAGLKKEVKEAHDQAALDKKAADDAKVGQQKAEADTKKAQEKADDAVENHLKQLRQITPLTTISAARAEEAKKRLGYNEEQLKTSTPEQIEHAFGVHEREELRKQVKELEKQLPKPQPLSTPPALPQPPVADAGPDQTTKAGSAVTFDGSKSKGTNLTKYEWFFGDGDTIPTEGKAVTHTYTIQGNFVVTLMVTDDRGRTATDTVTVKVEP